jgi:predicted nucleic acid-binding protein
MVASCLDLLDRLWAANDLAEAEALALAVEHAILVSGDGHLTSLAGELPILTPAEFLAQLRDLEP